MNQTGSHEFKSSYSPAMVFTTSTGQLVFVNRNFTRLNKEVAAKISTGLHLHELLPILDTSVNQLINSIRYGGEGYALQMPVLMPTESGTPWHSTCSTVAAHDLKGDMIGIDLVLEDTTWPNSGKTRSIRTHADAVMTYVRDVFNCFKINQSATFIQSYLISQLEVIQILLARVGGPFTRLKFEQILQSVIKKYLIPCTIQQGYLNFTEKNIDIQKYSMMLKSTIGYAIDVVGQQFVKQEMLTVDQSIEPGMLQLISQLDLAAIFTK